MRRNGKIPGVQFQEEIKRRLKILAVKKKDRKLAKNDSLNHSRRLVNQVLIITRPRQQNPDGTYSKPGILGNPHHFQVFGANIIKFAKLVHLNTQLGHQIKIKDEKTYLQRKEYFTNAINYCDVVLQDLDLCIFHYASNNKKKRKSLEYVAKLTYTTKQSLYDRINRDKMIYNTHYSPDSKKSRNKKKKSKKK